MRAVILREPGPPENLLLTELPRPEPAPGHALVQVRAAGVCYRDTIDRRGGFPAMKLPIVPGHEFAGEIIAAGEGVLLAVGTRVVNLHRAPCGACRYCQAGHEPRCERSAYAYGLTADGGYAEYVLAPAPSLVALPDGIAFESACFLACTAGVALRGLRARAELRPGQTVLITGASGGVGFHAIQVVKALGARVVAVTSSADKRAALARRGADEVIVSPGGAFHKQARSLDIDVALDCVGAPTLNASIRSVRPMGRVVVAGNVTIESFAVNPGYLILSEVSVLGTSGCTRADLEQVLAWVGGGQLEPAVAETLPLDRAADAHRRLEARGVIGRLVLVPGR